MFLYVTSNALPISLSFQLQCIFGEPRADTGGDGNPERATKKNGEEKSKTRGKTSTGKGTHRLFFVDFLGLRSEDDFN